MRYKINPVILRKYDIRGVYAKDLKDIDSYYIAVALGQILFSHYNKKNIKVVIGYDARVSSESLFVNFAKGLIDAGIDNIVNITLVATPMLYFAVKHLDCDAGIMITGSHNPPEYNGMKITFKDKCFFDSDIANIEKIVNNLDKIYPDPRKKDISEVVKEYNIYNNYIERALKDIKIEKPIRVCFDCGNGSSAPAVQMLSKKLKEKYNIESKILFGEVDGTFPNHHPDPTLIDNMRDLIENVKREKFDIGIAFDGDGDRIGIVDDNGEMMYGDQFLQIIAKDILSKNPNAAIVADVKSSRSLFNCIESLGGKVIISKTGHSYVKQTMAETGALLAGEMSGHVFFADKYYGFDDAIYASLRIIEILSRSNNSLSQMHNELEKFYATEELKFEISENDKFFLIDRLTAILNNEEIDFFDKDGIRVEKEDGWWLLRASNTQNVIVGRCESNTKGGLFLIQEELLRYLMKAGYKKPLD
jgi:phosphomannomutase